MPSLEAFGLNASDLNPFLFACVGTEMNGSALTVLSVLARLGSDPWAEAGRLATLPRSAAVDWLAERIAAMQLTAGGVGDARATAERIVLLLPPRGPFGSARATAQTGVTSGSMAWARNLPGMGGLRSDLRTDRPHRSVERAARLGTTVGRDRRSRPVMLASRRRPGPRSGCKPTHRRAFGLDTAVGALSCYGPVGRILPARFGVRSISGLAPRARKTGTVRKAGGRSGLLRAGPSQPT